MQAAWFFGANAAGVPAYDPATGRTIDGISGDGVVNPNSGAESTIHGLLTMLALDANPDVAEAAQQATITARVGTTTLQAEDASTTGDAARRHPGGLVDRRVALRRRRATSPWVTARPPRCPCPPADVDRLVMPVVDLMPGSTAVTTWSAGGTCSARSTPATSASRAPPRRYGALLPVTLPRTLGKEPRSLRVATSATGGDEARLDAVMLEPLVSRFVLSGDGHATALLRSADSKIAHAVVRLPGRGRAVVEVYDALGAAGEPVDQSRRGRCASPSHREASPS